MDNQTGVKWNSDRGACGELLFCYEAFNRGLSPCVPWGDPACFDCVVINKKTGLPMVTQVRTASKVNKPNKITKGYRWQVKAMCNNDTIHLRDTNVKVLVTYCGNPKTMFWYCIPVKKITGNSVSLYPHNTISEGKYERFKNNWSCFGFYAGDRVLLN